MVLLNGFRTAQFVRKPFWKSDTLSKAAGPLTCIFSGNITFPQLLLAHFARANQALVEHWVQIGH